MCKLSFYSAKQESNKNWILNEGHDKERGLCHLLIFSLIDCLSQSNWQNWSDKWKQCESKSGEGDSADALLEILRHFQIASLSIDLSLVLCIASYWWAATTWSGNWLSIQIIPVTIILIAATSELWRERKRVSGKY